MPIRPENKARYPKDWAEISVATKQRAGWKCQHSDCLARQYSIGSWRREGHDPHRWEEQYEPPATYAEARSIAAEAWWEVQHLGGDKLTIIVLTVAHLNHTPEDVRPENLAVMCQRHHLAYDADLHKRTSYATRKALAMTAELF